jgi:hypothetical protein
MKRSLSPQEFKRFVDENVAKGFPGGPDQQRQHEALWAHVEPPAHHSSLGEDAGPTELKLKALLQ